MVINYLDITTGVLAALYLVLHGANSRWRAVWSFAIVVGLLVVLGQPTWLALLAGILCSHLAQLPSGRSRAATAEHFANSGETAGEEGTSEKDEDEEEEDDDATAEDEGGVDMFRTMLESYKSLTPDQVEHMTSDTKELIETQKSLLETVKSLAPVVTQGKEMLDTFKDYFGTDTKEMLGAAMKTIGGRGDAAKKKRGGKR